MFSALFLDYYQQWCACKQTCLPACSKPCSLPVLHHFDFIIDCHSDRYGVEKIKGLYNRVIEIRIMKAKGDCFEPCQKFSACQFHGSFFANIKLADCHYDGASDIVADVYDACSFPVGRLVLVNNCGAKPCLFDPCSDHKSHALSDNCVHISW